MALPRQIGDVSWRQLVDIIYLAIHPSRHPAAPAPGSAAATTCPSSLTPPADHLRPQSGLPTLRGREVATAAAARRPAAPAPDSAAATTCPSSLTPPADH